ncbi:MAG TPA: quinolinate synthase NadA [bacterium]|nr:quinolinate synthase NadA [bacterium]
MATPRPDLKDEIARLKREKDALILVHNYQIAEVQEVADSIGDSLDLARKAVEARKNLIVFCGVRFMAETAKILNPSAKVLLPREDAGCPMADMVTSEDVRELRHRYPDAAVCSYVNTNADVKAETDICCTSANAVGVVQSLGSKQVIFTPDRNLAAYVAGQVSNEIIPPTGYCYVHQRFSREDISQAKLAHPQAVVMVHPECVLEVIGVADKVLSTSGMLKFARESSAREFIVATEEGLLERMSRELPGKRFYSPGKARYCFNMKKTRLEDVLHSLDQEVYEIKLDPEIMRLARKPLERMIRPGP